MPVGFSFDYALVCFQAITGRLMGRNRNPRKRSFKGSYIYIYIY